MEIAGSGGSAGQSPTEGDPSADAGGFEEFDGSVVYDGGSTLPAADAGGLAESGGALTEDSGTSEVGDDPCEDGTEMLSSSTPERGSGYIELSTSGANEVVSLTTTMIVPSAPQPQRGTLFLWPGLQPSSEDPVVGYGVLQPVLTWGSSCAPGSLMSYDTWWISAQYVGSPPGLMYIDINCEGGDVMRVETGDELDIEMVLNGTIWTQRVTNRINGTTVDFDKDLQGQKEQRILFSIERPLGVSVSPVDDVIFTSTVIKYSQSSPNDCVPIIQGTTDYFSPPRVSSDGTTCCLSKIILRARGVAPSSPDEP